MKTSTAMKRILNRKSFKANQEIWPDSEDETVQSADEFFDALNDINSYCKTNFDLKLVQDDKSKPIWRLTHNE